MDYYTVLFCFMIFFTIFIKFHVLVTLRHVARVNKNFICIYTFLCTLITSKLTNVIPLSLSHKES